MEWAVSERWLPVVGYEGFYEVSDEGRVRSLDVEAGMIRRRLAAVLAALMLGLTIGPAPQASAAIGGCSTWVTTYKGFLGVTIYRGHLTCYGSIPGKEYRAKIYCKLAGQTGNIQYGGWKREGSGKDSCNSCPWPWQTSKYDIHIQTR